MLEEHTKLIFIDRFGKEWKFVDPSLVNEVDSRELMMFCVNAALPDMSYSDILGWRGQYSEELGQHLTSRKP